MLLFICNSCFSVQQGGVQYVIPIDYSIIDEAALNNEAESLFSSYMAAEDEKQKKILLERMLSSYSILGNIDKGNPLYFTRLGIIFDKMGRDRYAKSNFCRATNLVPDYAYGFNCYGDFFFERSMYIKALREYMRAYNAGYQNNYDTLYQIGSVYEKLGDFTSAVGFYRKASAVKSSPELSEKIKNLEELLKNNSIYDEQRGMRK